MRGPQASQVTVNGQRGAPPAGIVFVVRTVAAEVMTRTRGGDDTNAEVAEWLADEDNQVLGLISMYLASIAGLGFVWSWSGWWRCCSAPRVKGPGCGWSYSS